LIKTSKIKTTDAHVCLVTHITALELKRLLDETQAFNGFANRFLWVCIRREKLVPLPQAMPEEKLQALQQEIFATLAHSCRLRQVELSPEACALWEQEYTALAQEYSGLAGSVINRGEAQVMRLALIYTLLDQSALINDNHLKSALAFWGYCERSALNLFEGRESTLLAKKRILSALAKGLYSTTELHKALGNSISKKSLTAALQELQASGRIVAWQERSSSKPKIFYDLAEFSEESLVPQDLLQDNSDYFG